MSETTNYKLFISDNDQMSFKEWRLKISGENDSNMTKIDQALSDLNVQADYSENDQSNRSYIKNRTHWKEVVGEDAEVIPQTTVQIGAFGAATIQGLSGGLEEDAKYILTINDTVVDECRCERDGNMLYIGNGKLISDISASTGVSYCILDEGDGYYIFYMRNAPSGASFKVALHGVQEVTYHKLDRNYLPDDLGEVKSVNGIRPDENGNIIIDNEIQWDRF
jgi:hypothetical protein